MKLFHYKKYWEHGKNCPCCGRPMHLRGLVIEIGRLRIKFTD